MPSKVFSVVVLKCADSSHANKIAKLLRKSFPHQFIQVDETHLGVRGKVLAENHAAIHTAISPALGRVALLYSGEMLDGSSGKLSPMPPDYMEFEPPVKKMTGMATKLS